MAFVLDASVTAAWLLPDETSPLAEFVQDLLLDHEAVVPSVWWFEVRNLLLVAERRGRITAHQTEQMLANLAKYPISIDRDTSDRVLFDIARRQRLTAYDAGYVELALRLSLPLATLDKPMASAASREEVELVVAI